jgi:uncharacterized membrane protein (GlpM family)
MKRKLLPFVVDAALVVLFVFIGTRNHDTDKNVAGVLSTAAPFLIGLVCGWWGSNGWKNPTAVQTGIVVWIATVVIGMLLRNFAWDRGTAGAFIVVATIFNAFTLIGWRVVRENILTRQPPG